MDDKSPCHTSLGKKGIKLACVTEVQEDLKYSGLYLELLKVSPESSALPFSSAPLCVSLLRAAEGVTGIVCLAFQLCPLCVSNAQQLPHTRADLCGLSSRSGKTASPFCKSTRVSLPVRLGHIHLGDQSP